MSTVLVEGDSLDPIARKGQRVLIGDAQSSGHSPPDATLAIVETDDDETEVLIKRVFVDGGTWTMLSPNPVDPLRPISKETHEIQRWWSLQGVLFESTEAQ